MPTLKALFSQILLKCAPWSVGAAVVIVFASLILSGSLAMAQEAQETEFLGFNVSPAPGPYKILNNVNVRAEPSTKGKRLGGLKAGEKITGVGIAADSGGKKWLAVRKKGKDLGFISNSAAELIVIVKPNLSIDLKPENGTYLTNKSVIVRAEPDTDSSKVSRFKKGTRVQVIGKTEDAAWLAVQKGGKKLGYIFAPNMLPLVDGALNEDISGVMTAPDSRTCKYLIHFDHKTLIEGEVAGTFDYDVTFDCKKGDDRFRFYAFMFITEAPFDLSRSKVYQINVDLLEIGDRYDEVMSVILMYDKKTDSVNFDDVSQKEFAAPPLTTQKAAKNVKAALVAAVEIAPNTWKSPVWATLSSKNRWPQNATKKKKKK